MDLQNEAMKERSNNVTKRNVERKMNEWIKERKMVWIKKRSKVRIKTKMKDLKKENREIFSTTSRCY